MSRDLEIILLREIEHVTSGAARDFRVASDGAHRVMAPVRHMAMFTFVFRAD